MRRTTMGVLFLLVAYSALLLAVEASRGPTVARFYLDDPPAPTLFGHVNTTLSAALLFGCALLFAAGLRVDGAAGRTAGSWFARSQVVFFLFLAADERFRILPAAARALPIAEELPYVLLAAIELALLLGPGRLAGRPRRAIPVAAAGALYAWSMGLDTIGHHWAMGYAVEELPKVWAGALLLRFAWRRFEDSLQEMAAGRPAEAFAWAPGAAARGAAARRAGDPGSGEGAGAEGTGAEPGDVPAWIPGPQPSKREAAAPGRPQTARGAHSQSGRP